MRRSALLLSLVALCACSAMYVPVDGPGSADKPKPKLDEPALDEPEADAEIGRVRRVLSGDLIELDDGRQVRYIGVVAPRRGEQWFEESLQANRRMVEGRRVRLNWDGTPSRTAAGAWLAFVLVPASELGSDKKGFVNASYAMVRSGSARAATLPEWYKGKLMLLRAEERARESRIGIWQGQ